ncbi:MAG: carbon storage regulator [Planctomycetota bacterium]|nr:carbon storage regulator [Planctomycetota bacterium]
MLVLARKLTEVIHIGDDIVIKVLQIHNGVVRIGIDAPDSIRVLRGELKSTQPVLGPTPAPLADAVRKQRTKIPDSGPVVLRRVDTGRN